MREFDNAPFDGEQNLYNSSVNLSHNPKVMKPSSASTIGQIVNNHLPLLNLNPILKVGGSVLALFSYIYALCHSLW